MDTLLKANIFFFITTIAVVVFLILGSIAFYYLIGFLKSLKRMSENFEDRIEEASEHADSLYHKIADSFLFSLIFKKRARSKK